MITLRGLFRDLKFLIGCFVYLVKHYSLFSGLKFQGRQERIVYLLCNGPSLKNDMETIKKLKGVDFIVVNFMANDSLFWEIKPQYYTLIRCFLQIGERIDIWKDWRYYLIPSIVLIGK